MAALKNSAGVVIGAQDAADPGFDVLGRRVWGPWSDRRARASAAAARDAADIDIDTSLSMLDVLGPSYKRLP